MAEPFIYKAEGSALWNAYCRRCKHRTTPAEQWPCSGCWNPAGDMYEFSPGEAEYASWRPHGVKKPSADKLLGDLLARIHRDGGHYVMEHGWEKAAEDAEAKVVAWIAGDDEGAHRDALYGPDGVIASDGSQPE